MTVRHSGGCHCGAIRFAFETARPLEPRACQCRFCRKHGARTVSDPEGAAEFRLAPDTRRYRFGTGTTDFLFCARCGVYVGAVAEFEGRTYATLNLNAFVAPQFDLVAEPSIYDGETAGEKARRRRNKWTPARFVSLSPERDKSL